MLRGLVFAFVVGVVATSAVAQEVRAVKQDGVQTRISAFSGKPVPRFESLKYPAVNGRTGPSLNHPVMWRYERSGLPVLVVKESHDWVKVRDPMGDEVWVHDRMLGGRLSVMVQGNDVISLKTDPSETARTIAGLEAGLIADLEACKDNWCQISVSGRKGWVEKLSLWGAPGAISLSM